MSDQRPRTYRSQEKKAKEGQGEGRMGPEHRCVLTFGSWDPFSGIRSGDDRGDVEGRRGGEDGRVEPDLCCLGSVTFGDRTDDLWIGSMMEEEGGRGGGLVANVVVGGMAFCW